jgi:hypothetical protein
VKSKLRIAKVYTKKKTPNSMERQDITSLLTACTKEITDLQLPVYEFHTGFFDKHYEGKIVT